MESRNQKHYAILKITAPLKSLNTNIYTLRHQGFSPDAVVGALNEGEFAWLNLVTFSQPSDHSANAELMKKIKYKDLTYPSREEAETLFDSQKEQHGVILVEFEKTADHQISLISYASYILDKDEEGYELANYHFEEPVNINMQKYDERRQEEIKKNKLKEKIEQEARDKISQQNEKREQIEKEKQRKQELKREKEAAQFTSIFSAIQGPQITAANVLAVGNLLKGNRALANNKNPSRQTATQVVIQKILENADNNSKNEINFYYQILKELIRNGAIINQTTEQDIKDWYTVYHLSNYKLYPQVYIYNKAPLPKTYAPNLSKPAHSEGIPDGTSSAADVFNGAEFKIKALKEIEYAEIEHNLFGKNDFLATDENQGREKIGIKLGNIYFQFLPLDTGYYELKIFEINTKERKLDTLFEAKSDEMVLPFESIVPFNLTKKFPQFFNMQRKIDDYQKAKEYSNKYYDIKNDIIAKILPTHSKKLVAPSEQPVVQRSIPRPVRMPSSSANSGSGSFAGFFSNINNSFWEMLSPSPKKDTKDTYQSNITPKKK